MQLRAPPSPNTHTHPCASPPLHARAHTHDRSLTFHPQDAHTHSPHRHTQDRSFTFILKTSPTSILLKKAAGVTSGRAKTEVVGKVTVAQVEEIAKIKMPDTNATKLESAVKMVEGTAKNMGITIEA